MKRTLLITLLFISIAFNISFVSIFGYKTFMMRRNGDNPPPPPPFGEKRMRPDRNPEFLDTRMVNMELRKEFFDILSQDQVDQQKLQNVTQKLLKSQTQVESLLIRHFVQIRSEMSPEQAREFFDRLGKRADHNCARINDKKNKPWRKK